VRAPATRDQADAYRFGVRRMETALVRADSVPLNEHIRTQRRSALAGVAVGLLALCAAAVYPLLAGGDPAPAAEEPDPALAAATDWRGHPVVTAAGSGRLFAVVDRPDRLVPVANLPAARLVLAAAGRRPDAATATPVRVADAAIGTAPQTAGAAVPGADGPPDATVAGTWAVCDEVDRDGVLTGTTVVGGAAPLPPAAPDDGVLVADPDDRTWLLTGGRRYRVDAGDGALLAAYGLSRVVPRPVDPELLDRLPRGPELTTPDVPDRGAAAPAGLPGRVGDVLVSRPRGGGAGYFVVLSGGLQPVPEVVADLLRVASGAREARDIDPAVVAGARLRRDLDVADWPQTAPHLQDPVRAPVLCWTWTADGDPAGQLWTGPALPPGAAAPVPLPAADGPGPAVDSVAVGPGGAVRPAAASAPDAGSSSTAPSSTARTATGVSTHDLRSAVNPPDEDGQGDRPSPRPRPSATGNDPGSGVLLVSNRGTTHPVADDATVAALGIRAAAPAPAELLDLLPPGPPLDLAAATDVVDALLR
jgi:ESX secretion system ATPase EccB